MGQSVSSWNPSHDASDDVQERADPCRLVLAASYPMLLEGLQSKFKSEPGFQVISCCTDGARTLSAVLGHRPDVLILDLQIGGKTAFEVLQKLKVSASDTRVVLLADRVTAEETLKATKLGVKGTVLKSMSSELLVLCVRKVHAGGTWFERLSLAQAVDRLVRWKERDEAADGRMTRRQLEVTRLAASGHSNKEIADRLAICEGTVKAHLHKLYERLGVNGRVELVLYAQKRDLLEGLGESRVRGRKTARVRHRHSETRRTSIDRSV